MIRLAIILLAIYLAYRVVRRFLGFSAPRVERRDAERIDDVMVKDPQCGAYFPLRDGIPLKTGERELHFCSAECRDRYIRSGESDR
jgi:hypothetical protein